MNNELNNNTPSYDPNLNETSVELENDTIQNEESTREHEEAKEIEERVDKKEKDLSLPTTIEDYMNLSKNFYAGFWTRFVAYLIIYAIASLLNTFSFGLLNKQLDFPILGEESLSYVIVMFTYFISMTYFFSQTLGKMIMKIKVETNKGDKLGLMDVVYREVVGRLLTIFLVYIPYLAVAFTNKKKGLHDFIADTVVVKEDFSKLRRQMNEKLESKN